MCCCGCPDVCCCGCPDVCCCGCPDSPGPFQSLLGGVSFRPLFQQFHSPLGVRSAMPENDNKELDKCCSLLVCLFLSVSVRERGRMSKSVYVRVFSDLRNYCDMFFVVRSNDSFNFPPG